MLFLIMFMYGRGAVMPGEEHAPPPLTGWMLLYGVVTTYLYIFMLFCINFHIAKRQNLSEWMKIISVVLISILFVFLWNKSTLYTQCAVFNLPQPDVRAVRGSMVRDILLGFIAIFSSQLLWSAHKRKVMAVENESLKAEYERARFEALKNQVDPHFLFNTLNSLNSIVTKDSGKTQHYIQKLSSIFRYTLQNKDVSTLSDEVAFTKDYCDLMEIRYGENLAFEFKILPEYYNYSVVPFSIQTLVENAIKHNIITNNQKLTVTISTSPDNMLYVSNPIYLKKEHEAGEGIGLANLSERYRLKWQRNVEIADDGKIFRVGIPLIPNMHNKKHTNV